MSGVLLGKRLGLLHELLPKAARFAVLLVGAPSESMIKDLRKAAASIGAQIEVLNANNDREIDASFASLLQKRPDALLVGPYALFADRHIQIVTLAGRHAIPAIYHNRHFTEAGGLMSYGPKSYDDLTRQVGRYTGRILNGEKPAELPVMQPTRFDLVINLNTARALGLTIPETLLASADKVIE
jgi:putative tryptophan/tyrosine transport system substrate-binding protein